MRAPLAAPFDFLEAFQRNRPTGKSFLIFRNRVKPRNRKYSASVVGQISASSFAILFRRGASAVVTNVGMGCSGRDSVRRERDRRAR
jgi:hypothetical protein